MKKIIFSDFMDDLCSKMHHKNIFNNTKKKKAFEFEKIGFFPKKLWFFFIFFQKSYA